MPSNHLILCHPLLLLPSFLAQHQSFPMSWLFPSGGQSIGASASVLSMNIQGWFPLGLTGLISLLSKELSRVFSSTNSKASILWLTAFFIVQLSHPFFWNFLAFSMIQQMLPIWSLVPLPLLNPACTSGSSQFTYCWSLAWKVLSITLVACETSAIVC